jgi:methylenetetrahydrofolate--tRNA-(uracil-5-)-methyltransferase
MKNPDVTVIGAGLAGCEAAWQLAARGVKVRLLEMKPEKYTPAHHYEGYAELVCSNSLKSDDPATAAGLLKAEMRMLGSLAVSAADLSRVPAGSALAVDRKAFSDRITKAFNENNNIEVEAGEVTRLPAEGTVIVATGPLTTELLQREIASLTGEKHLYFFDAASPVISAESVDYSQAFFASRYGKGGDYL